MPIRGIPLDQIVAADIAALKERGIREDQTLDFKKDLELSSEKGKFELLKDVSALANSAGGVLVYGVAEGDGEDAGRIVDLPGLAIDVDATQNKIDQLLHDGLDERIPGVLHRAIPREDKKHYLIIRVPPSLLAPHMVRIDFPRVRFYQRGTTTNQPMNARQIKELSLRAATAFDRAKSLIKERVQLAEANGLQRKALKLAASQREGPDQALLHVVPLFGPLDALDFIPSPMVERMKMVPAFGRNDTSWTEPRFALEGLYSELKAGPEIIAHNLFLRNGAIEFQQYDILETQASTGRLVFRARSIEEEVIAAIKQVQALTEAGVIQLPVLVSLTLVGIQGSVLYAGRSHEHFSFRPPAVPFTIAIDPILVTDWSSDPGKEMKRVFDMMWQAWGWPASASYGPDGLRVPPTR